MNKSFRDLLVSEDDEFGETLVIIDGEEGVPGDERFENVVGKINAAFNARVDEEVKEAVEEFRERAEIVVRQECGGKCGGDRGCEISRKIMEIPTEPEVK